jgi:hypothetical protein
MKSSVAKVNGIRGRAIMSKVEAMKMSDRTQENGEDGTVYRFVPER